MNDNNFNDEFFNSKPEQPEQEVKEEFENKAFHENYESVTADKADDFIPVKNIDEGDVREADFEDAQNQEAPVSFFQEYPRPDIQGFEVNTEPEFSPETAFVPEPEFSPEPMKEAEPTFNPYAPKPPVQDNAAQQVNPGYTHINQPVYNQNHNGSYGSPYQQNPPYGQNQWNPNPPQPEMPKKSKGKTFLGVILVCCLALAIVGMLVGLFSDDDTAVQDTTTSQQSSQPQGITDGPTVTSENIEVSTTQAVTQVANSVYVADKVRPSVVGVMTYADGMLAGEGSGVLMSEKDGWTYIVTCAHVISEDGVTYGVLLLDGRRFEAELVAYDTRTDIGVVKVEATGLPLAEFGDSTALDIGEPVYAIGNPGGSEYFGSITNGIVSAIDRSVTSTYTMTCIQHNAAINPGNSGGALVNSAGQVIGINSSKIASTEYEGMGFAVPTSIASPIVDALIEYGYVPNRPKLGIEYAPVSSYQLYSLVVSIKGLPQGSLVIAGISEDSSLAGTEAEVGDLIIAVNGQNMDDSSVLLDFIETGSVGDTLTLTLCRIESRTYKTSTFDVTITLVEDKGSVQNEEATEPKTEYEDDGYYRGGAGSFEDYFNDYFGW
ncbi:MAG: trypsin-like peptidase domain-containing protein [Clostridia bacterium]|nr:trypsin-like peptidase domain-containing protein [Clostridia bacterium]